MNDKIHIDLDGNIIPVHDQEYIWLGSLVGSRKLTNVALSSDAALVTDGDPYEAAYSTLSALKKAVSNNFVAAFTVLGAFGMAIHYDAVLDGYGMCPTPVVIGKKNTGKSTIALTALHMCGIPHFIVRDFTSTAPSTLNSRKTYPTVFDDPDEISKVKSLIDDAFNHGGRSTSRETTVTHSVGIVTINLDRLKKFFSNYK